MAVRKYTVNVPVGDTLTIEFVYDGQVVAEATVADVITYRSGLPEVIDGQPTWRNGGRPERRLEFEAGPVAVDQDGERHGADDGGEAWLLRVLEA